MKPVSRGRFADDKLRVATLVLLLGGLLSVMTAVVVNVMLGRTITEGAVTLFDELVTALQPTLRSVAPFILTRLLFRAGVYDRDTMTVDELRRALPIVSAGLREPLGPASSPPPSSGCTASSAATSPRARADRPEAASRTRVDHRSSSAGRRSSHRNSFGASSFR